MKSANIVISGFVQKVGFRQFVKQNAIKHNLTGWVKNTPENKVEALLQSSASSDQEGRKQIEKVIELCRQGPFLAEVKEIKISWIEGLEKLPTFDIEPQDI